MAGWPWSEAPDAGGGDAIDVRPGPVVGRLRVPGDKSVSHRLLLMAARAEGSSVLRGLSDGDDVRRTALAVAAAGAHLETATAPPPEPGRLPLPGIPVVRVAGGNARLSEPDAPIDVGNSGTGIRLLAGWAAALPWFTVLHGDRYIARRPMGRIVEPLRAMGAGVDGRDGGRLPPLAIRGGSLTGIDYALPVASAQVKGALLLAGLGADGVTTVREPAPVRAHTEELLALFGADVEVADRGAVVSVRRSALEAQTVDTPGDPSQAAFWVVAACVVPGSDVTVEGVYVGRGRAGFIDVLHRMGADVTVTMLDRTTADIRARYSALQGTVVGGDEVPGLVDEIPVLAVAAACADGPTEFRGAEELKVKETDRIATVTAALAALGAGVEPRPDGLAISGGGRLHGGDIDGAGDHRVAMAGAVAALAADRPSRVRGWAAVATSYPSFRRDLEALQA